MSELIVITKENAVAYFKENSLDSMIDKVEEHALNFVGDTSTKKGRDQIISKATGVRKIKVAVDTARKELNEERLRLTKLVNADGNKAKERLEEIIVKVRQPVTDWQEKDNIRIEAERVAIEKDLDEVEAHKMEDLLERERVINEREAKFEAEETQRQRVIDEAKVEADRLETASRIAKEARETAEKKAAQKIADVEQAVIDAEVTRVALEAQAKQDKVDAENNRIAAEQKAEKDRVAAANKAESARVAAVAKAEKDTADRIAEEARKVEEAKRKQKVIDDKKAANLNHRKRIYRETFEDLMQTGIGEAFSRQLIESLKAGTIRNVTINY